MKAKVPGLGPRGWLMFLILALLVPVTGAQAARHKVDCRQVMAALSQGQKPKAVAKEMGISVSSVYRCRKLSRGAGKPGAPPPAGR